MGADYKVLILLERVLQHLGFSGYTDRSSKVDTRGFERNKDAMEILDQIRAVTMNVRNRAQ